MAPALLVLYGNSRPRGERRFHMQCVARGPGAPWRGYIKRHIPLEQWNRHQPAKLAG